MSYNNFKSEDSIECLGLSQRSYTALRRAGILTIGDLIEVEKKKGIANLRGVGKLSFKEIMSALNDKSDVVVDNYMGEFSSLGLSKRALNLLSLKYNVTTMKGLLALPIDKRKYGFLDVNTQTGREIVDKVHMAGYRFECEELVDLKRKLLPSDSIYKLSYFFPLTRCISYYGIETIEDLLKLSTDRNIPYNERGIYNIKGIGDMWANKLIETVHSLGLRFECEVDSVVDVVSLDELFNTLDSDIVFKNFYEKVDNFSEMSNNNFVLFFVKKARDVCSKEDGSRYNDGEILEYLAFKLVEHKKKLASIASCVSDSIDMNRRVKKCK